MLHEGKIFRTGSVSFDSKKAKDKVKTDPHTQRLVGFADDDLRNADGIDAALTSVTATLDLNDEAKGGKEAMKLLAMAKHFFVLFYFTSLA